MELKLVTVIVCHFVSCYQMVQYSALWDAICLIALSKIQCQLINLIDCTDQKRTKTSAERNSRKRF